MLTLWSEISSVSTASSSSFSEIYLPSFAITSHQRASSVTGTHRVMSSAIDKHVVVPIAETFVGFSASCDPTGSIVVSLGFRE